MTQLFDEEVCRVYRRGDTAEQALALNELRARYEASASPYRKVATDPQSTTRSYTITAGMTHGKC